MLCGLSSMWLINSQTNFGRSWFSRRSACFCVSVRAPTNVSKSFAYVSIILIMCPTRQQYHPLLAPPFTETFFLVLWQYKTYVNIFEHNFSNALNDRTNSWIHMNTGLHKRCYCFNLFAKQPAHCGSCQGFGAFLQYHVVTKVPSVFLRNCLALVQAIVSLWNLSHILSEEVTSRFLSIIPFCDPSDLGKKILKKGRIWNFLFWCLKRKSQTWKTILIYVQS